MSYKELGMNQTNGLAKHYGKTFLWMALGLIITAGVAWYVYDSTLWIDIAFSFQYAPLFLLIAQLVLVMVIGGMMQKLSFGVMLALFFVYSALTGVNLSVLPLMYGIDTMAIAFVCASLLFVNMGIIGVVTKQDLSKFRTILIAGLFTLIIVTFINMFMDLEGVAVFLNYAAVLLFMGLTAYDMQKVKHYYNAFTQVETEAGEAMLSKLAIYSALQLYLDFINMFLYILRILGRSRRN